MVVTAYTSTGVSRPEAGLWKLSTTRGSKRRIQRAAGVLIPLIGNSDTRHPYRRIAAIDLEHRQRSFNPPIEPSP